MRLLLVAPTADRDATGESWIAYQWASRLSQRHDVTVLSYYQRAKPPLARQLPDARVIEWREPPLIGRHERFSAMLNPGYFPFAWRARRWIRSSLARGEQFDVAHQVAPVSLRYASPLAGLGIPYFVGPVGGSVESPPGFTAEESGAPWFTALRALDGWRLRHDPGLRRSFSEAAGVIGIAEYVGSLLDSIPLRSFQTMNDTGIDELPPTAPGSDRVEGVRFLFVGRVIRTKGVRDVVRAMSSLPPGVGVLDVVGDGYDRARCEQLASELGVANVVHFHGRVPHDDVLGFMSRADGFVFPSYREAGGIVVTEAMSYGLPVIVCDNGGPASTVDDASGIKVPAQDPTQLASAVAEAMRRLAGDPELRARMGAAGRARIAATALWDRRIDFVEELYESVRQDAAR